MEGEGNNIKREEGGNDQDPEIKKSRTEESDKVEGGDENIPVVSSIPSVFGGSSHSTFYSPTPYKYFNWLSLVVPGRFPSTPGAGPSQETSSTLSWFDNIFPLDSINPLDLIREEKEKIR